MDQMISAVGGFVSVDFKDPSEPLIKPVSFDLISSGYCLCMTDTRSSHSDLTDDYAAIPAEMSSVAEALGAEYLRDADEQEYFKKLPELRKVCSDRALLRAAHFFGENERAVLEAEALSGGDLEEFFRLVNESGDSSAFLLQNLFSPEKPLEQDIPLRHLAALGKQAQDGANDRGLSAAGLSHKTDDLSRLHFQAEILYHRPAVIFNCDMIHCQHERIFLFAFHRPGSETAGKEAVSGLRPLSGRHRDHFCGITRA